mgnify:CR=1 FL=1
MKMKLYDYWRSSAAYRVRIALALKGLDVERVPISIFPGEDEQFGATYKAKNPQMRVPTLEVDGKVSGQSMAIIEWLEEIHPAPALLPSDPWKRLQARAFADVIACDVHPLNNLAVLKKLRDEFSADEEEIADWYRDWIIRGFTALETTAQSLEPAQYLFGDQPGIAEICLVPQVANAHRYKTDLSPFPRLMEVEARCRALPAFIKAAPDSVKPAA